MSVSQGKLVLLRLGVHPASRAWTTRDGSTCAGCVFLSGGGLRSGFPVCTHPANFSEPRRCFPWWPACILRSTGMELEGGPVDRPALYPPLFL
jgi:hypothetical protein